MIQQNIERNTMKSFLTMITFVFLCGCSSVAEPLATIPPPKDSSRTSIDWVGAYEGNIHCTQCATHKVRLALYSDKTYIITEYDANQSSKPYHNLGTFRWDEQGQGIFLQGGKESNMWYQIGENKITVLDKNYTSLPQTSPDDNILYKTSSKNDKPIKEVENYYWKLISLGEKPLALEKNIRFPYIFLQKDEKRFYGFAGCNRVTGAYTLPSTMHISFPNALSTRMMCQDIALEQGFLALLNQIKTYQLENNILSAFDANKTLLGKFQLIPFE